MDAIKHKIKTVLNEHFDIAWEDLQADNSFVLANFLDSIELVQFALDLETEFNLEIPDESVTANMTISQVVEKIRELGGS